ncbi:nucleoside deaminase [Frondihabitans peucedani]|uniref:Nucleoside deaminase n=1 Tax=Frondihabitans peucedani TaxID=598626 RepID=A0ABP8E672_9MICO
MSASDRPEAGVEVDAAGTGAQDHAWLARAIELAVSNVADGGGPFGALIVRDGEVVAEGQNRVTRDLDPTAHAEVVAIRAACQVLGDFSLAGCVLYTSCEPCPLCLSAALWSRVDRVVFAADRHDAARGGFDDLEFYELFARDRSTWALPIDVVRPDNAPAPFDAWLAKDTRTDY